MHHPFNLLPQQKEHGLERCWLWHRLPIQVCMVGQAPQRQSTLETVLFTPRPLSPDQMEQTTVRQVIQRLEKGGICNIFPTGMVLTPVDYTRILVKVLHETTHYGDSDDDDGFVVLLSLDGVQSDGFIYGCVVVMGRHCDS